MFKKNLLTVLGIFCLFVFVALGSIGGCHDDSGDGELDGGPPGDGQSHTINIINNCSQTVWVGAFPQVESVMINSQQISTLGGWQLESGQKAVVTVPFAFANSRIWARTDCMFDSSGTECPNPPGTTVNCCDTGGCEDENNNFVLDCAMPGVPPATLAEFTLDTSSGGDNYDVSLVDGFNIPVQIEPTGNFTGMDNLYHCQIPGCTSETCNSDFQLQDCGWGIDVNNCPLQQRLVNVPPFVIPPSCMSDSDCTGNNVCGVSSGSTMNLACGTYGGCLSPQKACALVPNLGMPLDCQNNNALYACSNDQSCYTTGAQDTCCGCPSWTTEFDGQDSCISTNPEWTTNVEPIVEFFKNACPTAYSFPFDDSTSLFHCESESGLSEYTVTFCPPVSPIPTPTPTPGPVPTCPPGPPCDMCSAQNPFCCPATSGPAAGGCASSPDGLMGCEDPICTIE